MKKNILAGLLGLGMVMPLSSFAATVSDDELIKIAQKAVQNAPKQKAGVSNLRSYAVPAAQTSVTSNPMIGMFVTLGEAVAPLNQFQPTPCFGCLITTASPNTFGITLPSAIVSKGSAIQYVYTWQDVTWNDLVTASFVIMNGSKVINVASFQGFLEPSIWSLNWPTNAPYQAGENFSVVAIVNYGTHSISSVQHYAVQ
jgi:hypothetical protein